MANDPKPARSTADFAAKVGVGVFVGAIIFTVIAISVHLNALVSAIAAGVAIFVILVTLSLRERKKIAEQRQGGGS